MRVVTAAAGLYKSRRITRDWPELATPRPYAPAKAGFGKSSTLAFSLFGEGRSDSALPGR